MEKSITLTITLGIFITVIGGLILYFLINLYTTNPILGITILIFFVAISLFIIYRKTKKKKALLYVIKGEDRDEWLGL